LRQGLGTGQRHGYASAIAGLWSELSHTLARLESIAAEPEDRLEDALDTLPPLQYALHRTGELVVGIDPPPGSEIAHAELAAALADARDATAEVLDAVDSGGPEAAGVLVHEWRGALFRVRLARHRLLARPTPAPLPAPPAGIPDTPAAALVATVLILIGVGAFTTGAVMGLWQLWAAGLTLVASGLFAYRP
jgi:hypothetical protein